ncbi:maltose O-acetyltransferase [Rhodoblastus acidophilus]|uniref:acyltransferase n=1 Tax=Rhodoblastus acidophilus TaxID=1074 RepID=UPI0029CAB406|nr:DapH/DapD/GlmU-related protein [Rhodoblastus acidophilus]MCW2285937.1 maltose O-acetyltransferase [Rhodoblastus acidophilus]MCW2334831.1 maltose O-acetyltransferase [Rhodoblastus acidophilus]
MMVFKLVRRIFHRLIDALYYEPRAILVLRGCELARGVRVEGDVVVTANGRISIGRRAHFRRGIAPQDLSCDAGAEIVIGPRTMFNYGGIVKARHAVRIGANCRIGSFARLDDSAPEFETRGPIVVEDDVWIAHGAVIAPGVTIGHGAVVAAGSVVARDVPANTLAMGNPARCFPLELVASGEGQSAGDASSRRGQELAGGREQAPGPNQAGAAL